jgi:hypothetical protein
VGLLDRNLPVKRWSAQNWLRVFLDNLANKFPHAEIAEAFDVAPHTISPVVNGVRRQHIA